MPEAVLLIMLSYSIEDSMPMENLQECKRVKKLLEEHQPKYKYRCMEIKG